MVNLKNITELPLAESVNNLNLIVNDNGSAKQIAASALGGVQLDGNSVYVIDSEAYTYGDDALDAILKGKQILIKVPNKNNSSLFTNFMPVLQYQLPNENNNYLNLFYFKDGIAENIMAAMQTGSFDGVYGVIEMMLSETYTECPLKVSPIK